eukprot:gene2006-1513_t
MKNLVGVECGGTSFKVSFAQDEPTNITETKIFLTSKEDPNITIKEILNFLKTKKFDSLAIASFGPLDLNKKSPTYGFITSTPKKVWQNFNLLGPFKHEFQKGDFPEIQFDTDVNAPALSEYFYGGHGSIESTAYITVGTGVGIGLVIQGKPIHGLLHPEGGHMYCQLSENDLKNNFKGTCPFHGNCVEGMVSSGSICARKGIDQNELPKLKDDDEVWDSVAHYLAHLCVNIILLTSVDVIVVGGGIFQRKILLSKIHKNVKLLLNNYLKISKSIEELIVISKFDSNSGVVGALTLSEMAL